MLTLGSIPETVKLYEGAGMCPDLLAPEVGTGEGATPGPLGPKGSPPLQCPISLPSGQGVDGFSPWGHSFFQHLGFLKL